MKHSSEELKQWQMLPLEIKERMSLTRIIGWIHEYGVEGVYEAFSGGKDSTVLSDLIHRALTQLGYEDVVPRVYSNTGLEWPSVRLFAQKHPNVVTIRPSKTFREVIIQYGYPIIGKEVSECIDSARKFIDNFVKDNKIQTDSQTRITCAYAIADLLGIERRNKADRKVYEQLKEGIIPDNLSFKYGLPVRLLRILGKVPHTEAGVQTNEYSKMYDKSKWIWLLDAPKEYSTPETRKILKLPQAAEVR